jgi:uncharacterized protein (TIGR02246 family)
MHQDEHAIRKWVDDWMLATIAGDTEKLLNMLDEDVIFMTPGREPFDKEEFARTGPDGTPEIEGTAEIVELKLLGDWAYTRVFVKVEFIPKGGGLATRMSGYTLGIFRKDSRGNWLLHRDANLVMPEAA